MVENVKAKVLAQMVMEAAVRDPVRVVECRAHVASDPDRCPNMFVAKDGHWIVVRATETLLGKEDAKIAVRLAPEVDTDMAANLLEEMADMIRRGGHKVTSLSPDDDGDYSMVCAFRDPEDGEIVCFRTHRPTGRVEIDFGDGWEEATAPDDE
jgi:hypothetical protein